MTLPSVGTANVLVAGTRGVLLVPGGAANHCFNIGTLTYAPNTMV